MKRRKRFLSLVDRNYFLSLVDRNYFLLCQKTSIFTQQHCCHCFH